MMDKSLIFTIDGGATKTAGALWSADGECLQRVETGPCNLYQAPEAGIAAVLDAWRGVATAAGMDAERIPDGLRCCFGVAGLESPGARETFEAALERFAHRHVCSDGEIGLVGALEGKPGALLSIGTGIVAGVLDAAGRRRILGGWGFPAGDRGSGASIGLRVVGDYLAHRDSAGRRTMSPGLIAAVEDVFGASRRTIVPWLKAARPGDFAAFARPLVEAADEGDHYARAVLADATAQLLPLAERLLDEGGAPLRLGGGLATTFHPRLVATLGVGAVQVTDARALHGAWLIAAGRVPPPVPMGES